MNEWNDAKKSYEETELPRELNDRVRAGMAEGRRRAGRRRVTLRTVGSVAACFAVLLAGLNISPAFAAAAAEVPVVGKLCMVLTVRNWERTEDGLTVRVDQPAVSGDGAFAQKINQEIQSRVDAKIAEGNQIVAEYKDAFLSTGGTEEEWAQRENEVSVTYEIKSQTPTAVSFVVNSYVTVASAYQEQYFYNLDVANDRELTLADVLGDDWTDQCNQSIREQMAASEDPAAFFDADMGGFTTVDETTGFYLNEKGNPVVVFPRATVAIGAMGTVEFEIQK